MCRGEGNLLSFSTCTVSNSVNWEEIKIRRKNTANKANYQSSNVSKVSTNEKSRNNEPNSRKCVTNQSGDSNEGNRKRKAFWRDDNPGTKKSKVDGVQLGV